MRRSDEMGSCDAGGVALTSNKVRHTALKMFRPRSKWIDKDEFLDVVYWLRQVLGLVIGLLCGLLPLKGILGLLSFVVINCVLVYVYAALFQQVDEDEYGGFGEILKEGLMTSFATFLVAWVLLYDALHVDTMIIL